MAARDVRDVRVWMWSEACEMLGRADRLHRQFFQLRDSRQAPAWEPPADVLETEHEVAVIVALPGVDPDQVQLAIEGGDLVIMGMRVVPQAWRDAVIHRLELPQGRFERRLALPAGRYSDIRRAAIDGCVLITLRKAE
jgi:HSP20 family protein